MTLVGRTSAFFLGVLALVLIGFTAALTALAQSHLHQQVDERLEAALVTLKATIELKPEGLEWEPHEHTLTVGVDHGEEQVRWVVSDGGGRRIARSENLASTNAAVAQALLAVSSEVAADSWSETFLDGEQGRWRSRSFRLQADRLPMVGDQPARRPGEPELYPVLVLTAGLSLRPVEQTLSALLIWSAGVSLGLWLFAALLGRWLCRRALAPLTRMAATARAMPATELHQRLPAPGTRDELEDLGLAFNDLLTRVEDAFARQQRFTGEASHQLRTPLAALLGQVEVALRRERAPEEYRQTLARVERQGRHLVRIVEMLLFLARADADAALPDLELLDLAAWLPGHLTHWSDHPRAPDLVVEKPSAIPLWVRAHPTLLGQLLDNLLENAFKYSTAGSPVTLRLGLSAPCVQLEIQDCGVGMSPENLAQAFQPFFRAQDIRRRGLAGVGLGLAVVRRIAVALGGTVRARSEPGAGSVFTLELPAAVREEEPRKSVLLV